MIEGEVKTKLTTWKIDPNHTEVSFRVKHLMISTITGYFRKFDGTLKSESDTLDSASVEFEIDIDSIDTNNENRNNHLRTADFFDIEHHPKLKFTSSALKDGKVTGEISMRGVTKEITLNVEFNGIAPGLEGEMRAGYEITGELNRKDFGLQWNGVTEAGGVVVSDNVKLLVNAQFIKQ